MNALIFTTIQLLESVIFDMINKKMKKNFRLEKRMAMKINEIIKKRRLVLGLTQEQVGAYLGVSTPAVNKWERDKAYPDITLLAPPCWAFKSGS